MGITVRDLYFVLRARDEASTVFNAVGRDIVRLGANARSAALMAEAGQARQLATSMKANGATKQQIDMVNKHADALEKEAKAINASVLRQERLNAAVRDGSRALAFAGVAMVGVGVGILAALGSTVKAASDYGHEVSLTKTQVDGFKTSLQQLGDIGKSTANHIAAPFKEIQPALYNIFSTTNANVSQATKLLSAFSKEAVAGSVSINDASKGTMTILNGFGMSLDKVNSVLDVEFQLVRKGVGTFADFNGQFGKIIPSANAANQSFETTAAMLAFMTRNGQSAAAAASSGARALDAFANPKTVNNLKGLGVEARDSTGKLKPLADILVLLREKILKLPPKDRLAALLDVFKGSGGTIQAMRFIKEVIDPLNNNSNQLQNFLALLGNMKGASGQFGQAYKTMATTTAAQTQLMKNRFEVLKVTVGQVLTPTFGVLVGIVAKVLEKFNDLPKSTQGIIIKIAAFVGVLSIIVGVVLLVISAVGLLVAGLAGIGIELGPAIAIVVGVIAAIVGIGLALYKAFKQSLPLRDIFGDIVHVFKTVTNQFRAMASGIQKDYQKYLAPAFARLWAVISLEIIPVVKQFFEEMMHKHSKDFIELFNTIKSVAKEGFQYLAAIITGWLIPAIQDLIKWYEKHKTGVDQVISALITFGKWVLKIAGGAFIGFLIFIIGMVIIVIGALIAIIQAVVTIISTMVHWISNAIGALKTFWGWLGSVKSAVSKFGDAVASAIVTALKWVASLPGKFQNAVAHAGTWLYNAGRDAINGLIQGFKDKLGALGSVLGDIGDFIKNHKGPPAKDAVMLVDNGKLIIGGLIKGIDSMMPSLQKQLKGVSLGMNAQFNVNSTPTTKLPPLGKYITNNITVNEANKPTRKLAQDLGSQLAGMM